MTSCLYCFAQQTSKLAISPVEISPTLQKKHQAKVDAAKSPSTSKQEVQDKDLTVEGKWNGNFHDGRKSVRWTLIVAKTQTGTLRAEIEEAGTGTQRMMAAKSVALNGSQLTFEFPEDKDGQTRILVGEFFQLSDKLSGTWNIGNKSFPVTFTRAYKPPVITHYYVQSKPTSEQSTKPVFALEDLSHALDVQLFDHFSKTHTFSVTDDVKSREASYLLTTTLEDVQEQTLDLSQGKTASQTSKVNQTSTRARTSTYGGSSSATQTQSELRTTKQQFLHFTVRFRLFETSSGRLLESLNRSFSTNRVYTVLAKNDNTLETTYLADALAREVANWELLKVSETVFPIKILDKSERIITINRGRETGIQLGTVYLVYVPGKEIKDPVTGELLGRDELGVGKVSIMELQDKFSKARVLGEDKGIVLGALLRRSL